MVLGGRNHRLRQTPRVGWSSRPCWCRRSAPRAHATQKRYLALRKHGSATRHSISPSRAARRQARAFAPRGAVCLSLSQYSFFSFFFFFFSGAADEGLPRKQRKVRMKENIDTTCGGVSDAGSHWARTTYSAPWSVITSAPRSVPMMLKLATLPRSRQQRD